jgi:ABC-type multidrug transport system fused ATPase/permease subunit
MISHSLSQIIDADYTYVMKDGQIVEHGEHHELYRQDGTYKEIFDAMAKSLNIEKIAQTFEDDTEEETHS